MTKFPPTLFRIACLLAVAIAQAPAWAGTDASEAVTLDRVVVTTRLREVPAFEVPASTSLVELGDGGHAGINLSEYLGDVPGLAARDRQNYAQDTQLSIRGFGARTSYGVRGIRLYADGIPATMPDGQGQVSHFSLLGGDRVEVMRGPFSALYGNSSGGVLQIWSADPTETPEYTVQSSYGRDNSWSLGARALGTVGALGYNLAAQRFATDGYRPHSAARRDSVNGKFVFDLGAAGRLDLIANGFYTPYAQDPLGLTREQVRENPRQTTAQALLYNTRKSIRQNQLGAVYALPFGNGHQFQASAYGGRRHALQYQSIPASAQANPTHAGGIIDLDNGYGGADVRWSWHGELAGRPLELTVGANFERQRQNRRGFENFLDGGELLGVRGVLRRDERDSTENFDQYAQVFWRFAPRWSLLAGLRHSRVRFDSRDFYITDGNPDDSGKRDYSRGTPVFGASFAASDDLRLYAASGSGFETPTFNEMSYRADGGAGLALDLEPARSRNHELGAKWRNQGGVHAELALFRSDTEDELVVASSSGGRTRYQNAGRTRRQGLELAAGVPLGQDWTLQLAYTRLDATFRDSVSRGAEVIAAGSRIPGTTRDQLRLGLSWRRGPWNAGVEGVGLGDVFADDQGTARAAGYFLVNLEAGHRWTLRSGALSGFVRLDNLLGQDYIGSVIVNESNGRYYEPGPGRGATLGLRWNWSGQGAMR